MTRLSLVILPLVVLTAGCGAKKTDKDLIQGTWTVVSFEADGKPSDELAQCQFVFAGDQLTITRPDREVLDTDKTTKKVGRKEVNGKYRIDPAKSPKEIDLLTMEDGQEKALPGVYTLEQDALKIVMFMGGDSRPTSMTPSGEYVGVISLKRDKP
jgi:uncharacterized protein (TIGR03067 family)